MKKFMLLLLTIQICMADWDARGYVPDNSINWDGIVPLIQILIPYGIFVGAPIIITLIIYSIIKTTGYGTKCITNIIKDFTKQEGD